MPVAAAKPAISLDHAEAMFHSFGQRKLVLGLLLVLVTLALYNPVSRNGFVSFDDDRYVTENPHVHAGLHWSTAAWAFTSIDQANWHPLTWLSHALDCQLFGLNPIGHHYTNLLLHATNSLLLFMILQWFTGYTGRSLMVAALFAVHPLNVEPVAWVAERKNLLCMFFFLLALAAYGRYVRKPGIVRYLVVALFFAMGLMSKPMVITMPFVLLLLDYWPLRRFGAPQSPADNPWPLWKLFLEKLPLLALSVGSAIITMIAQRANGAILMSAAHDPLLRLKNVILCYSLYIAKTIWPSHLAVLYPYPHTLPFWEVAASAVFLITVTSVVIKCREHRYLAVGWFWYLGTMVPMIGLIQVGNQSMADRYAYLPVIGIFIMVVWAAAEWADARQFSNRSAATALLAAAGIIVLTALSVITHLQLRYWHDDFTLWSHTLAVTHDNFVAENNLGNALMKQGQSAEAIVHFRAAAAIEPKDPISQLNLGIYAEEQGDLQQAAARYEYSLQLASDAQIRASAYANLGTVYFALHNYGRAQQSFDSVLKLNRVYPVVLLDMGLIEQKSAQKSAQTDPKQTDSKDNWNRAAAFFAQFVAFAPSDVGYLLLANALHQAGHPAEADLAYRQARRLSPDIAQAQQKADQLGAQ